MTLPDQSNSLPNWTDPSKRDNFLRGIVERLRACADVLYLEDWPIDSRTIHEIADMVEDSL